MPIEAVEREEQEYTVEITETLQRTVVVKAKNKSEAIEMAKEIYRDEEVVLDYNDLISTEFEIIKEGK